MRDFETGLTAEEIRRLFRYVKSTGHLIRRVPVMGGPNRCAVIQPAGKIVGTMGKDGYLYVAIRGRMYLVHRLIYVWVKGEWPEDEVDHHNGVRHQNNWKNLRPASKHQNRQNSIGQHSRKGPYPGVYEKVRAKPGSRRFVAQIKKDGVVHYLGVFHTGEAARAARIKAERAMFKEFAGSLR